MQPFKSAESKVEDHIIREILNGNLPAESMLLPERAMADELNFSRPVVHKAMTRLFNKGLVAILPRKGVKVLDYRLNGKIGLLDRVYHLDRGLIDRNLNQAMLVFVKNTFSSILGLFDAADKVEKAACLSLQKKRDCKTGEDVYAWMHQYALYCGNPVYPLLLNEFRTGITNVGAAMVSGKDKDSFVRMLGRIDSAMASGSLADAEAQAAKMFAAIEKQWLGKA